MKSVTNVFVIITIFYQQIFLKFSLNKYSHELHLFHFLQVVPVFQHLPFLLVDLQAQGLRVFRLLPFHRVVRVHRVDPQVRGVQVFRDLQFHL